MGRIRYRNIVADSARWEGFEFRDGDIVISTPPKCGTTWTQMLVALLVFDGDRFPKPIDEVSPWLDQSLRPLDEVVEALEAQTHRRFIKTHTPLDGLPWDDRVTYLCVGRDPRDVSLSWEAHVANLDLDAFLQARADAVGLDDLADFEVPPDPPEDPVERFHFWIAADDKVGIGVVLATLLHHLRTFWDARDRPNVHLFHYGDYQADLLGQFTRLATALGAEQPPERLSELVATASFDAMKARAVELAPNATRPIWKDTSRFFHRGRTGAWREIGLGPADLQRYEARVAELVPADLAHWAHHGWLGEGRAPIQK